LKCDLCKERVKIVFKSLDKRGNIPILPSEYDTRFNFICEFCSSNNDHQIIHKEKIWHQICATALFNLDWLHGRQYYNAETVMDFVFSNWDKLVINKSFKGEKPTPKEIIHSCKILPDMFITKKRGFRKYVSLAYTNNFWPAPPPPTSETAFVVEDLLDKEKRKNGHTYYLCKWAGFSDMYNSWEKSDNLDEKLVSEYEKKIGTRKRSLSPTITSNPIKRKKSKKSEEDKFSKKSKKNLKKEKKDDHEQQPNTQKNTKQKDKQHKKT